uniref:Neur_chan_LBD domain-containing protein n=1 Tax=Loa loa TaxID=7209 RepID=A0A1I7VKU7_LOALO
MEIIFAVTFTDDRLAIRKLKNRFRMPAEYHPWLPEITTRPNVPVNVAVYLDPLIGMVDAFYRYSVELLCSSETWRHPFELFQCEIVVSNIGDERIFLRDFQDLRNAEEISKVSVNVGEFLEVKMIAIPFVKDIFIKLFNLKLTQPITNQTFDSCTMEIESNARVILVFSD